MDRPIVRKAKLSSQGFLVDKFKKKGDKEYKRTEKFLVVGPSGSGKTSIAVNLVYYLIAPCNGIVFILPKGSHTDTSIKRLQKYCEKAKMPFYIKTFEDYLTIPDIPESSVWVIDDYYTSTNRDPGVERFIKGLVNNGRHEGKHIIYCAHLANRLPAEIKINNTGIFISGVFASEPDFYSGLDVSPPKIMPEPSTLDDHIWYKYNRDELERVAFKEPINESQIIQNIRNKIPKKIRDKDKKIIDDSSVEEIAMSAGAGNKVAKNTLKKITAEDMWKRLEELKDSE